MHLSKRHAFPASQHAPAHATAPEEQQIPPALPLDPPVPAEPPDAEAPADPPEPAEPAKPPLPVVSPFADELDPPDPAMKMGRNEARKASVSGRFFAWRDLSWSKINSQYTQPLGAEKWNTRTAFRSKTRTTSRAYRLRFRREP